MGQLEERVRGDVDEWASSGAVPEDRDDEERDLVRDDVANGPTRHAHERGDGRMPERGYVPQVHVRAVQRGEQCERHDHDSCRGAEAHEQHERVVVEHAPYRERPVDDTR